MSMSISKGALFFGGTIVLGSCMILSSDAQAAGWFGNKIEPCLYNNQWVEVSRKQCKQLQKNSAMAMAISANQEALTQIQSFAPTADCITKSGTDYGMCEYSKYVVLDKMSDIVAQNGRIAIDALNDMDARQQQLTLQKWGLFLNNPLTGALVAKYVGGQRGNDRGNDGITITQGSIKGGKGGCVHTSTDSSGLCTSSSATIGDQVININYGDGATSGSGSGTFTPVLEYATDLGSVGSYTGETPNDNRNTTTNDTGGFNLTGELL